VWAVAFPERKNRFNPTLVRLRRFTCWGEREASASFNPTLVRLRHPSRGSLWRLLPPFQSHAGSIEAGVPVGGVGVGNQSFNPTLVRLRPLLRSAAAAPPPGFQSHAGSIEARPTLGRGDGEAMRFQSHAGSIEANKILTQMGEIRQVSIPRWFD